MQLQGYPYVSATPGICGGVPCVTGHRIPVHVLGSYIQMGVSVQELAEEYYPWLTLPEIHGALTYFYDHLAEVEADVAIAA